MNKRMKKKYALEARVRALETYARVVHYFLDGFGEVLESLVKRVEELEGRVNVNAQDTNKRFAYLEKKVADKVSKKSWFNRK